MLLQFNILTEKENILTEKENILTEKGEAIASQDILANCPEDAPEWYFIPMLQESDTDVSRYPLEVRRQLSKLGSYIFGPSTIYSEKCPLYVHEENATQRHHENMKAGHSKWEGTDS